MKRSKERVEELIETRNDLEAEVFSVRRELDTLKAQYDAAIHINASTEILLSPLPSPTIRSSHFHSELNAQLPLSVRINIEEDELANGPTASAAKPAAEEPAPAVSVSASVETPAGEPLFDTSATLDDPAATAVEASA